MDFTLGISADQVLAGPALGLPILWGVAGGIGGFLYATRQGLASGVHVRIADE